MNRLLMVSGTLALVVAGPTRADFSAYFFSDSPDFVRNGSTVYDGGIRLTTDGSQAGSYWRAESQYVANGFETTFRFRIEDGPTLHLPGDGFAFVLQDEPSGSAALGGGGSDLGYAGLSRSVAIEFDTFGFSDEFPTPHVSVQVLGDASDSGSLAHAALSDLGVDILDGRAHTASVQYAPPVRDENGDVVTPGQIEVYIDATFVVAAPLDLQDVDGDDLTDDDGRMFAGFTAGTGLADSVHVLESWAFLEDTAGACVTPSWYVASSGAGGAGSTANLSAQFTGTRPITYRWYQNDVEITDDRGGRLTGLGTDTIQIADIGLSDGGFYFCLASNACGEGSTAPGSVIVPCPADFNFDGNVDPDDLGDFINCYFAQEMCAGGRADFNEDGNIDPDDLGDFINTYFGPPCS